MRDRLPSEQAASLAKRMFRPLVLILGLMAGLAGVIGVGYAVLGRTVRWERVAIRADVMISKRRSGTSSLLDQGL